MSKPYTWNFEKNEILKLKREISFEEIKLAISENGLIDVIDNPNKVKYPNQKMLIVKYSEYIYIVPFVEDSEKIFLKTIFPSKKATNKYLIRKK